MTRQRKWLMTHRWSELKKVSKGAKIRNRYNQAPHLTQHTNGKVTNSQLDTANESQEVSSFPAGDHKAHKNRRAQRHSKHKTEQKQKKYRLNILLEGFKISKVAKIRNRYNQVPHLTQDTNGKVTNSQKTPQTRAKRSALSQQVTTKHI